MTIAQPRFCATWPNTALPKIYEGLVVHHCSSRLFLFSAAAAMSLDDIMDVVMTRGTVAYRFRGRYCGFREGSTRPVEAEMDVIFSA